MTNRQLMQTLDNELFESVMHDIYFNTKAWCRDKRQHGSTPQFETVVTWLDEDVSEYTDFWKQILPDDKNITNNNVPLKFSEIDTSIENAKTAFNEFKSEKSCHLCGSQRCDGSFDNAMYCQTFLQWLSIQNKK